MEQLQEYIEKKDLKAEILTLNESTSTVTSAAATLGCQPGDIAKSIVIKTEKEKYHLIILPGDRNIKMKKLKRLLDVEEIEVATPKQVMEVTGYPAGGVPPIGLDLPVIIDEALLTKDLVYSGGGTINKVLKITVEDLLRCITPIKANISKKAR